MTILCWECNKPSGEHRMDCGSKSRVDALDWFINSLHSVPEEVLDTISHKIHVEIMERNNTKGGLNDCRD